VLTVTHATLNLVQQHTFSVPSVCNYRKRSAQCTEPITKLFAHCTYNYHYEITHSTYYSPYLLMSRAT